MDLDAEPAGAGTPEPSADELLLAADGDPLGALRRADALAERAVAAGDGAAGVALLRVAGKAARVGRDIAGSLRRLDRAVALGDELGLVAPAAEARITRAASRLFAGDPAGALADLDAALAGLDERRAAVALAQRAGVLAHIGRTNEAEAAFGEAIAALERSGDEMRLDLAHALNNRGLSRVYGGRLSDAEDDLRAAASVYEALGLAESVTATWHNLGFVAARRGDPLAALDWFYRAERSYRELGVPLGPPELDHAEALLLVGITSEATRTAAAARARLAAALDVAAAAEALLLVATATLQGGDHAAAEATAREASEAFAAAGREPWQRVADLIALAAAERGGKASPSMLSEALAHRDALRSAGQDRPAVFAQLLAARLAARLGLTGQARGLLDAVPRSPAFDVLDVRVAHAAARAAVMGHAGDRAGALRAALEGIQMVDRYRAILGALDLRAHVSGLVVDLRRIVVRDAVASGRPERVWRAVEAGRALALRFPFVLGDDEELVETLRELRVVTRSLERLGDEGDPRSLMDAQVELQRRALDLHRRSRARSGPVADRSLAEVRAALGDWVLLEYVELDGDLVVVVVDERARLVALGPCGRVADQADAAAFALRRLAAGTTWPRAVAVNRERLAASLAELDHLLVGRLALAPVAGVVVVPSAGLFRVPWSALPSLAGTPVVVCPAASLWQAPPAVPAAPGRVLVAAGPGLAYAEPEASAVAAAHRRARVDLLTARRATAAHVAEGLADADLAHLAAHCVVETENPLFSRLDLADGPLFAHDLLAKGRVPATVVLSACSSGEVSPRPGDEILGIAAVTLVAGARHLVASVAPVPDTAATVSYMAALHAHLANGAPPPAALAVARTEATDAGDPGSVATTSLFSCYGVSP